MESKFSKMHTSIELEGKIGDCSKPQVRELRYLGSIIQNDGKMVTCKSYNSSWVNEMKECFMCYL